MKPLSPDQLDKLARVICVRGADFCASESKVPPSEVVAAVQGSEINDLSHQKLDRWLRESVVTEKLPAEAKVK
jgi:hypothetical protein